jgi:hypothetical protein
MDRVVSLELPSAVLRLQCIAQYVLQALDKYMPKPVMDDFSAIVTFLRNQESAVDQWGEADMQEVLETALGRAVEVSRNGLEKKEEEGALDLTACLLEFVRLSEGWSFRELEKVVQNMLLEVLSTEK